MDGGPRADDGLNTSWGPTSGVQSDTELDDGHEGEADRGYTSDSDFNYENLTESKAGGKQRGLFCTESFRLPRLHVFQV